MATRTGAGILWAFITDLFDGDDLNREKVYKECIHRLQDYGVAVRDMVHSLRAQLSSQEAGSPAVLRGTVDMSTLAFYDPIDVPLGSLDGLTLIATSDLAGPVTITFAQPTSPAAAAAQANAQGASLGITFSVDDGTDPVTGVYVPANVGKFRMVRPGGGTATITLGNGTANGILGFTNGQAATGTGTANDGASKIGIGAISSPSGWPGGPLRVFLEMLFTLASDTSANSFLAFGGTLPQANASIAAPTAYRTVYRVPALLGNYEYTLPSMSDDGYAIMLVMNPNPPNTVTIRRPDTTIIAVMDGQVGATTVQQAVEVSQLGGAWSVVAFGVADENYTFPT